MPPISEGATEKMQSCTMRVRNSAGSGFRCICGKVFVFSWHVLRDNTWHFSLVACLTHSFLLLVWICHRPENACRREDSYSHVSFCSPRSPVQQRKPTIYFCVGTKQLFSQTHKRSRSRDTVCTACKQPCASSKGILYRRGALEVRPEVRWL